MTSTNVRPRDDELDMFGLTHVGHVRSDNQDQFLLATVHPQIVIHNTSLPPDRELPLRGSRLGTVMLVADGVGGATNGGEASRLATEAVAEYVSSSFRSYHAIGVNHDTEFLDALRAAALQAHERVCEAAERGGVGTMATTLTLGIVVYPWMYVVQVGDSRAYIFTGGQLRQITRDQTMAQALVDEGALEPQAGERSPLRHILVSALGGDQALPVVSRVDVSERGCVLFFCSDGLTNHVSDQEIAERCASIRSAKELCHDLLQLALARGGTDNVTIVVARAPVGSPIGQSHAM